MRVALITNGIASTLHASLELARRLTGRGHEVTVLSHVDVATSVEAHGQRFVELRGDRDAIAELRRPALAWRAGRRGAAVLGLARLPLTVWHVRRRTAAATELLDALRDLEPDLLVIDTEAHVAVVATARLDIPTVLTTFLFAVDEHPGVPPIDSRLGPHDPGAIRREWERVRADARRARRRRRWSRRGLVDLVGPVTYATTSRVPLWAVARRSGFDLRRRTDADQWLRPHTYTDLPTLSSNLWELEFRHERPAHWHYVGPMVMPDRIDMALADGDGDRWAAFRARNRAAGRPLVYASLGSYWSADRDLLGRIVEVFRGRADLDLVLGLGGRLDPAELGVLPDHVLAMRWAPQVDVLAHADAAIVHGGNAALNECVVAGVPMVVYSTGHLDQHGVAARVVHHGIGRAGDARLDPPAVIEAHLDAVLGDAAIRERISAMRALAIDPSRTAHAVDLLEQLVATRGRGS